ncbi:MAG: DUF4097 family beta strand repeat-containing protein [Oscillospiraceae bacterium]
MKKILCFLIPVCILSFIGFWVSSAILGTTGESNSSTDRFVSEIVGGTLLFGETVDSGTHEWEIEDNEFNSIKVLCGSGKTVIQEGSGNTILIKAQVPNGRSAYIAANGNYDDREVTIEISPKFVSPSDFFKGIGNLIFSKDDAIFSDSVSVTITLPPRIYSKLDLKLGSGKLYVDNITAQDNIIEIGSGAFEMQRKDSFISRKFSVTLGSGRAMINNMLASSTEIIIGSGRFEFTGVSGNSEIEMGSGSGDIVFAGNFGEADIDMGSGSLGLYVEKNGAVINANIASGSVKVDACGVDIKCSNNDDDSQIILGKAVFSSSTTKINLSLGSGSVKILDADEAPNLNFEYFDNKPARFAY